MRIRRILAVLLTLTMLLASAPCALAAGLLPEQEHAEVPYESLENLSFDLEEFERLCLEVQDMCTDAANTEAVSENLATIREMYLTLDTMLSVAEADCYRDVTDEAADERYDTCLEWYYEEEEYISDAVSAVLAGPCAGCIDQEDLVFSWYLYDDVDYSEDELNLYYDEQDLVDSYYDAAAETYLTTINGTKLDYDGVYEAWYNDEISEADYDAACEDLAKQENDAMVGIYLELVKNRNEQAACYGYDNAADYYDEYSFFRDYSDREREKFYEAVKTYIVPLMDSVYDCWATAYYSMDGDDLGYSGDELRSMLRTAVSGISEELFPALDYMETYGYYDFDDLDTKADTCYTQIMPLPNAPFLFLKPSNSDYDFTTVVHEFGHYNAYFCSNDIYASNIDLAEIHSQGLELLAIHEYDEIFDGKAEYEELYTVYEMLYSLVDGCMYDELERYAYQEKNLTADKLNTRYMQLLKEYGYREGSDSSAMAYDWVEIPHLFSSPMYYLSYAVSAAGAFEIWEQSLEDYDGAVETYLKLVALGEESYFSDTLKEAGMSDPITPERMEQLADIIAARYEISASGSGSFYYDGDLEGLREALREQGLDTEVREFFSGYGTALRALMVIQLVINAMAAVVTLFILHAGKVRRRKNGEVD